MRKISIMALALSLMTAKSQTTVGLGIYPTGTETGLGFRFQNAGLFFETAPFFETDDKLKWQGGLRTVAGFVFYFPKKN